MEKVTYIPLAGNRPSILFNGSSRVISDVAALINGNMLLLNAFPERSRISKYLNLLRLLYPANNNISRHILGKGKWTTVLCNMQDTNIKENLNSMKRS